MANLKYFTQDFLLKLISSNAQWVNKPMFHTLIHLCQSIACFGPASIFATEKFEIYNGVVKQAPFHSNWQSPSHEIAKSFKNYAALRFCFSGGIIQAEMSRSNFVTQNSQPLQSSAVYDETVPLGIKTMSPNSNWIKVISFELDEQQRIKCNSFIYVKAQSLNKNFIAYIISIWGAEKLSQQKIYLQYGYNLWSVLSDVNAQHHCAGAKCLIKRTLPMRLERQVTDIMLKEIHHNFTFNLYVINTASLRSKEYHHDSARTPTPQIQPLDALNAVCDGLSEWKKINNSKGKNKASEIMTSIDPSLA
ncbi:hypothetical protein BY996DRAFT_8688315 [Phakopsora pachyrhizi]|nr:hypothetical protein BY996DRAFT_8688315 [Phakopsora pachyrhizi]